jgi:subtilisin family serine protease
VNGTSRLNEPVASGDELRRFGVPVVHLQKKFLPIAAATLLLAASGGTSPLTAAASPTAPPASQYVVLMKGTTVDAGARTAIETAGGTITKTDDKLGYAFVSTTRADFAQAVSRSGAVTGAARDRVIGSAPQKVRARTSDVERLTSERASAKTRSANVAPAVGEAEPLASLQWDMRQIGATTTGSYAKDVGSKKVRVGVIDTGIDGTHPDIAPNFDAALSHNFVVDKTDIDGPCEHPSCVDPANEDDDGHGTHVASTIGSPINGLGIAGVAPGVDLINIRAGQDSGYFFLQPTLEALEYAGDIGVDVVNMSFYTDPWLYNCLDNPADTPAEQTEQRVIRTATQRALNYAVNHGVLPVAALGNESTDLNNPTSDDTSPDYPADATHPRTVDNSCIDVPTESKGVVAVSSTGPSLRKAFYSNWGTEETDVAAPGGDGYDSPSETLAPQALVLAAFPASLAKAGGYLNDDGTPNTPFVVQSCKQQVCGYYQYLQGTSMATPHAVGVAALVVSRHGKADRRNGGLTLAPAQTRKWLYRTATKLACPSPRTFHYTVIRSSGTTESDATCSGGRSKNGFYGHGVVNAYRAVS